MKTGISIYLSSGQEKNQEVIKKAVLAGVTYGFTSLHIPEEEYGDYKDKVLQLLKTCADAGIGLMMDVDNKTPGRLGIGRMEELTELGVRSIRLDYGFSEKEILELSKSFHIVWNASTISFADIRKWERLGADPGRFAACHNFYPKPYTGLSLSKVKEINGRLKSFGFETQSFVPGDGILRGPIFEGLPTVEDHRNKKEKLMENMLELYRADSDIVLVGDVDLTDQNWAALQAVSEGIIPLHAEFYDGFRDLALDIRGRVNHDRPDSSEFIIRSAESRSWFAERAISPQNTIECQEGSICISNDGYLRYKGEIEICRCKRPADERVNVIGRVREEDLGLLRFIENGMGFKIV